VEEKKSALAALPEKYAAEMDFADATLVRASELFPSFKIVTDDSHFNWYRRNRMRSCPSSGFLNEWAHRIRLRLKPASAEAVCSGATDGRETSSAVKPPII